jgi:hypothetical protein
MAQDLAHFFFHRTAILGGAQAKLALQFVVESTDQEGRHVAINDSTDISDINVGNACAG